MPLKETCIIQIIGLDLTCITEQSLNGRQNTLYLKFHPISLFQTKLHTQKESEQKIFQCRNKLFAYHTN